MLRIWWKLNLESFLVLDSTSYVQQKCGSLWISINKWAVCLYVYGWDCVCVFISRMSLCSCWSVCVCVCVKTWENQKKWGSVWVRVLYMRAMTGFGLRFYSIRLIICYASSHFSYLSEFSVWLNTTDTLNENKFLEMSIQNEYTLTHTHLHPFFFSSFYFCCRFCSTETQTLQIALTAQNINCIISIARHPI